MFEIFACGLFQRDLEDCCLWWALYRVNIGLCCDWVYNCVYYIPMCHLLPWYVVTKSDYGWVSIRFHCAHEVG